MKNFLPVRALVFLYLFRRKWTEILRKEIPPTAVAIKVTHITNPSFMTVYEEKNHLEKISEINEKLRLHTRDLKLMKNGSKIEPNKGDVIHFLFDVRLEMRIFLHSLLCL